MAETQSTQKKRYLSGICSMPSPKRQRCEISLEKKIQLIKESEKVQRKHKNSK